MQVSVHSRQNHFQNTLSLAIFMLIICYYAFNGVPDASDKAQFLTQNSAEENIHVTLETNISHLRAAVVMDADVVQINGDLYAVENALGAIVGTEKAKVAIQRIHKKLLLSDKQSAVRLINALPTLVLK
jgi:hypothetical protein